MDFEQHPGTSSVVVGLISGFSAVVFFAVALGLNNILF